MKLQTRYTIWPKYKITGLLPVVWPDDILVEINYENDLIVFSKNLISVKLSLIKVKVMLN